MALELGGGGMFFGGFDFGAGFGGLLQYRMIGNRPGASSSGAGIFPVAGCG